MHCIEVMIDMSPELGWQVVTFAGGMTLVELYESLGGNARRMFSSEFRSGKADISMATERKLVIIS